MNDELKSAAERLGGRLSGTYNYRESAHNIESDTRLLARAYLDEHDETPVTEEWLRSIGFVGETFCLRTSEHREECVRLCIDLEEPRAWFQETIYHSINGIRDVSNVRCPLPKTRGEVRRLLAALGVLSQTPTTNICS